MTEWGEREVHEDPKEEERHFETDGGERGRLKATKEKKGGCV